MLPSHDTSPSAGQLAQGRTPPLQWPWALSAPPVASSEKHGWTGALMRRWSGTSSVMVQPPLDQHYVVMHLGGAKRVARQRDGAPVSTVADDRSLTIVPAGTSFTWRTSGPIAFAHLYLRPQSLEDVIGHEFDVDARGAALVDRVGFCDPQLQPLFGRMLSEIESTAPVSPLLLDCLLQSFLIRLARNHSSRAFAGRREAAALAPHRLRRVLDFIEANLNREVALDDLVAAAGTSQYHFSHAFRAATGCSPYGYLIRRRIDYAKVLLMTGRTSLDAVRTECGFNSRHQFAVMFKRVVGIGPKKFCMMYRSPDGRTIPEGAATPARDGA